MFTKFPPVSCQTNVYRAAQERKVGYFKEFHHKAVVVIPPHHELRRRRAERRGLTGYEVPENDLKAMKGLLVCVC